MLIFLMHFFGSSESRTKKIRNIQQVQHCIRQNLRKLFLQGHVSPVLWETLEVIGKIEFARSWESYTLCSFGVVCEVMYFQHETFTFVDRPGRQFCAYERPTKVLSSKGGITTQRAQVASRIMHPWSVVTCSSNGT